LSNTYPIKNEYAKSANDTLKVTEYTLNTDVNGFIRAKNSPVLSERNIVVLGDSVVECLFLSEQNRMCAIAEFELAKRGTNMAVVNGGISGATSLNLLNVFLNKIVPLHPTGVVLMSGAIDIDVAIHPDSFWSEEPYISPIRYSPEITPREWKPIPSNYDSRSKLLSIFMYAAKEFEIPFMLSTFPHSMTEIELQSFRTGGGLIGNNAISRLAANNNTRQFALLHKVPLLDLESILDFDQSLFYDSLHLNESGGQAAGRELTQFILQTISM
jgi:lysophospholipase L1-like esterase